VPWVLPWVPRGGPSGLQVAPSVQSEWPLVRVRAQLAEQGEVPQAAWEERGCTTIPEGSRRGTRSTRECTPGSRPAGSTWSQ
jgi:hypothetical protein